MSTEAISPAKTDHKTSLAGHAAPEPYKPKNKVRIVTAASLFDGHDAAINIMRRIIQATGCEVIHLGHDRSVEYCDTGRCTGYSHDELSGRTQ